MSEELDFLWQNSQVAEQSGDPILRHLASRVTILDYVRLANTIARQSHQGKILDWGCGFGHMSYLLKRRGFEVVSYDLDNALQDQPLPLAQEICVTVGTDPVRLPFGDAHFDATLSCGVLEHVPDENGSLEEIRRILKPNGNFFIFNLPQKYSYKEFLLARFKLGYTHKRKYTLNTVRALLATHGFRITAARRGGILPHNMTGFPSRPRQWYNHIAWLILSTDLILSRIPMLNRLGETIELVAIPDAVHD